MNSPSNPFASPTTGKGPDAKELLDTVIKMNESHKAQFSNLSNKYDQLLSMLASDRKTLVEGGSSAPPPKRINKTETDTATDTEHIQYAKQIVEVALKAITPFEVGKARQDGTV